MPEGAVFCSIGFFGFSAGFCFFFIEEDDSNFVIFNGVVFGGLGLFDSVGWAFEIGGLIDELFVVVAIGLLGIGWLLDTFDWRDGAYVDIGLGVIACSCVLGSLSISFVGAVGVDIVMIAMVYCCCCIFP